MNTSNGKTPAAHRLGDFTADRRLAILVPMAGVVGAISAFVAYGLIWLIGLITNIAYYHRLDHTLVSPSENTLGVWAVLVPVVGALIIGLMARYGSERIRGHGIPEAMEAILIGRSRMDAKVAILKPLSSAISIGSGGPFGAEGPIIMTGGAFGSLFAQSFHLTAAERKTLLVAGAAAGMAAVFATPLAALLIAVELLLFEWKPRSFVPVATAVIIAAVLRVPLMGHGPLFPVAAPSAVASSALLFALAVGVLAGLASAGLTGMVYLAEDGFLKLPFHFMWWPVIGGFVVGIGGLIEPRALGVGYDVIREMLAGQLTTAILTLLIVKAVIWAFALGSGTSGGVLAPLLIMGGALGVLEAHAVHATNIGLWAMVSMGAMLGGTMRSPLTAVAFLAELTGDWGALPALLVACVVAHAITVMLMKRSILTEKVARRGYHVMREYVVSPFARFRVGDVMEPAVNVPTIPTNLAADAVLARIVTQDPVLGSRQEWPIVSEDGELVGLVTRGDLMKALDQAQGDGDSSVLDVGASSLVVAHPDELLEDALARMARHGIGRLPVVQRDAPTRLIGLIGRDAMTIAYRAIHEEENLREVGLRPSVLDDNGAS